MGKKKQKKKRGHAWAYLLPELWQSLTCRPITVSLPEALVSLPSSFRGRVVVVDSEACRGCGLCARDCPAEALELERVSREEYRLVYHPDRCAYCGQCADSCPHDVLDLTNEYTEPTFDRDSLTEVLVDQKPEEEE